jgi:ketosteroid isomerase-like protein
VRDELALLRRAYEAFNARDVETVLSLLQPDVDWPNAMEGGREHGHEAVRAYWTRQFEIVDSHVAPTAFERREDGLVVVHVHQVVRDLDGRLLSDTFVKHAYTFCDGLVSRMDVLAP